MTDFVQQLKDAAAASRALAAASRECPHGQLARSCTTCALEAEVRRLTAENAAMRSVVEAAKLLRYAAKKCSEPLYEHATHHDLEDALAALEKIGRMP